MSKQGVSGPATLFYVYAHADETLREQLEHHLSLLQRQGLLLPWHDRQIEAGEDWEHAIDEQLENASIILLLISPDFLASDYCYDNEMRRALERQRTGQARVIPLILRPCDWQTAPFGHLQALPRDGRAITTWTNQDEAFLQVSRSLRKLLAQPLPAGNTGGKAAQNRANMLVKLQRMYNELLDDSLRKLVWIDLPLNSVPGAVHTATNLLLRRVNLPAQSLAPGTTVQQVYQQANQELLILGKPGAGKSTLLYQLGRDLLTQAQHPAQPLPVVFPLSSWSKRRLPLHEWMVEQLSSSLYNVPRWQSQQWVQNQQILPLLDGLDEVEETARPACVAAINSYHNSFPLCPIVVCTRSQEYQTASQQERLHLYSAVEVQPLTEAQQEEALQQAGTTVEELRTELANNAELRELAKTPLWLNILLLTAKEAPHSLLSQERVALQREVLQRYIQWMCERKGNTTRYPLKQTERWLSFLAGQMRQRSQTFFVIENVQPDWLPRRPRSIYRRSVGLSMSLIIGLDILLGILLVGKPDIAEGILQSILLVGALGISLVVFRFRWLGGWVAIWTACGIIFGLVMGLVIGQTVGLVVGVVLGLVVGLGSVFQHVAIRFLLAWADDLPWQIIAFLNDACERTFLRRAGGTYRFIHQLVLDYFADLEEQEYPTSHNSPSTQHQTTSDRV